MSSSTRLIETTNISLRRQLDLKTLNLGELLEVPAIGDGNCSLNAFALGLIQLIKTGRFRLANEQFQLLRQHIINSLPLLRERLKLYRGEPSQLVGNAYLDLADSLAQFINFVQADNNFSADAFITYIQAQRSREQIGALHVALAPALRSVAIAAHIAKLDKVTDDAVVLTDAQHLAEDGREAGQEILQDLAEKLQLRLRIVDEDHSKKDQTSYRIVNLTNSKDTFRQAASDPVDITLLHVPGHWNFVTSPGERGLVSDLRSGVEPVNRKAAEQKTQQLRLRELQAAAAKPTATAPQKRKLDVVSAKEFADTVKVYVDDQLKQPNVSKENLVEVDSVSTSYIEASRELAPVTKDALAQYHLHEMQQKLILGERDVAAPQPAVSPAVAAQIETDEALARALQNAEIAEFLSNHFRQLSGQKQTSAKPVATPVIRPVPKL